MRDLNKYKECKVEYVDNLETDFKVNCAEIKPNEYRIYGRTKTHGYDLLEIKKDKQKAIDFTRNLDDKIYTGKIIIERNFKENMDNSIDWER